MPATNPHREEILALLRRADCHYGNALRDADAGLTVDEAADKRKVRTDRIVALRAAVRRVGDGEHARTKGSGGPRGRGAPCPAAFRSEMSDGLRQHIDTGLARLKAQFLPHLKAVPLQCHSRGGS